MPSHEQTAQTASRLSDPVEFVAPAITFPRVSCAPYIWPQAADLPITKTVAEVHQIGTKLPREAPARQRRIGVSSNGPSAIPASRRWTTKAKTPCGSKGRRSTAAPSVRYMSLECRTLIWPPWCSCRRCAKRYGVWFSQSQWRVDLKFWQAACAASSLLPTFNALGQQAALPLA